MFRPHALIEENTMIIEKKIIVNQSIEKVWTVIGEDFDLAYQWMSPIPHSYAIGKGEGKNGAPMEGRICHLSDNPDGAKAKEVLTEYDATNKRLTFEISSINVPAIVPVKKNTVTMSLNRIDDNCTEVVWLACPELKLFAYPLYPLLRFGISIAFGKLLGGLKEFVEQPSSTSKPSLASR